MRPAPLPRRCPTGNAAERASKAKARDRAAGLKKVAAKNPVA